MTVRSQYDENYQQIAADHVAHWRLTGENPWQTAADLEAHATMTLDAIARYAKPGDRILDAGCGMGDLLLRLDDYRAEGCDIANAYLQIANERKLKVKHANLERLPYTSQRFDVVCSTDVLEHVLDLNAALRQLLRVLKDHGVLIVRVPDKESLVPYLGDSQPYRFVHLRNFEEAGLRLLLDRVFDMEVLEVTHMHWSVQAVARK